MPGKKIKTGQIRGTVEWFDAFKGNGYIRTDDGNLVLLTYKELPIQNGDFIVPKKGQKVIFYIESGVRGPEAKNLKIIN